MSHLKTGLGFRCEGVAGVRDHAQSADVQKDLPQRGGQVSPVSPQTPQRDQGPPGGA